jgi:hypothetical protein
MPETAPPAAVTNAGSAAYAAAAAAEIGGAAAAYLDAWEGAEPCSPSFDSSVVVAAAPAYVSTAALRAS